jgi:hypothetical protein
VSFVGKDAQRLKSPQTCATELLEVAVGRDLDEFAAVLAVMCVGQESDFWCPANHADPSSFNYPHDSVSNDGRSVAYFQQQNGEPGEDLPPGNKNDWWGPMSSRMDLKKSGDKFLSRLRDDYRTAINDPALASEFISNVQRPRPDLRGAYAKHWDKAWMLIRGATKPTTGEPSVVWTGDPVWLEDVLRPALGDRLKTLPGWKESGHGDFKDIRGTMIHHTGNSKESAQSIRTGRPDLEGPLSNLHIAPDGTVTIVAVGVCWHAGAGSYPWLPTDMANWHMIGIECAWPDIGPNGGYDPHQKWPDPQIISMRDTCAALCLKLAHPATRVIGHKDYAGAAQGKWDPGNLSMEWFRGEVAKDMRGEFDAGEASPPPVVPPLPVPVDYQRQSWEQVRGRWNMLGEQTIAEAVAEIRDHVLGTTDRGKPGVRFD